MHLVNSWRSKVKQWDKFKLGLRISIVTILCIDIDLSGHKYNFTVMNFRLELGQ